jgi:hypothetical protein
MSLLGVSTECSLPCRHLECGVECELEHFNVDDEDLSVIDEYHMVILYPIDCVHFGGGEAGGDY